MATRKKLQQAKFSDYFGQSHQGYLLMGQNYRNLFLEAVNDTFKRKKNHLYIAGQPGVGKSWTVDKLATQHQDVVLLTIKQKMSAWAFIKLLTVSLYKIRNTKLLLVPFIDDQNAIFKDGSEFLDIFKNAMDKKLGDRLEYNKSLGVQLESCDDIEKEAIEYYRAMNPDRTGFILPFNGQVKFVFTMNTPIPGAQELAQEKEGTDRWIKLNNRSAIRSRVRYENLIMNKEVYWGWIADVTWHEPLICQGATYDQRFEMLIWLWDNWDTAEEHSLRFIDEKLWDVMEQYPQRPKYLARWEKLKG